MGLTCMSPVVLLWRVDHRGSNRYEDLQGETKEMRSRNKYPLVSREKVSDDVKSLFWCIDLSPIFL